MNKFQDGSLSEYFAIWERIFSASLMRPLAKSQRGLSGRSHQWPNSAKKGSVVANANNLQSLIAQTIIARVTKDKE